MIDKRDPLGARHLDVLFAQQTQALVTTLVNLQSKHRRRFPIETFLPKFGYARYRGRQSPESILARAKTWVKSMGGKIINKDTGERME